MREQRAASVVLMFKVVRRISIAGSYMALAALVDRLAKIERGTIRGTKRCPSGSAVEHGERFDVQGCAA
jgi:hypothetical protein